jgi:O-antigen ligase
MPFWTFRSGFLNLLMFIGFLLPFNPPWLGLLAVAVSVFWILSLVTGSISFNITSAPLLLSLILLLYLFVMYLFVFHDEAGLAKTLETRAGLWLGLFIVSGSRLRVHERRGVWNALRAGLDVSLILCFLQAFWAFLTTLQPQKLIHSDFSRFMHAGYLSVLIFTVLFNELLACRRLGLRLPIYVLSLILLGSKAVWAAMFLAGVILFLHPGMRRRVVLWINSRQAFWLLLFLLAGGMVVPRIVTAWRELQGHWPEKAWRSSVLVRQEVWRCGMELASEAPFWGMGEARLRNALNACYEKKAVSTALKNRYNLHNQFLEEFILHGFIGMALFFLIGAALAWQMAKHDFRMAVLLMLIFLCWGGSESFLQRSQGCLWLGFVWPLSTALYEKDAGPD